MAGHRVVHGGLALGVVGFTVNAVANGHIEGRVALLGETLSKVLGSNTSA